MEKLTLQKFEEAAEKVKEVTLQTNLVYSEYFSAQSGNKVYLKPENMQYTGAYKLRGAYYKISTLSDEERNKGLITASAGNHAQGVAYAAHKYGVKADMIIGCAGGGSNLGGLISPFAGEMLRGEADYEIIAVEPASCPSLTRGRYAYDYCDTGKICPLAKMYTLGSGFIPSANHAGGLRYHGMSSIVSQLYDDGYVKARSVEQTEVFKAAETFARVEGILPAPESSHAIKVAIDEALKCKETGEEKNIVFGLTGTGYFDMYAYQKYNDGEMSDYIPTDEEIAKSLAKLPVVD